jgi:hypothetical protein
MAVDRLDAPRGRRRRRRGHPLLDLRLCLCGIDDVDDSHTLLLEEAFFASTT